MNNFISYKTLISPSILMVLLVYLLSFSSCEKVITETTYDIKGRFLKNCNQEPIANYSIEVYVQTGFGSSRTIGKTTTNQDGYFSFLNVPSEDCANIHVKHTIDANYVTTWGYFPVIPGFDKDNGVFEMGDFYEKAVVNTVLVLNIDSSQFNSMDTLYIGLPSSYKPVYPIPKRYVYLSSISSSISIPNIPSNGEFSPIWEIGKTAIDSIIKNNDISNNKILVKYSLCTYPDTTYYNIP
tara:strand:+ start:50620 stop:51336 length:717 start_codon:yes stop_codon:yes gene_type:complete